MKTKLLDIFVIIFSLFILFMVVIEKDLVYITVNEALNIWVNNLIPTLLPFFIISDILINYNITSYIPKIIKVGCQKLFNITDNMLTILFLSMISGFPSCARNTRILYDNGEIDTDEANHILMFAHFANPLFILTTVGIFFFGEQIVGIILIVSHYLSNIILGIFLRNKFNHKEKNILFEYRKKDFGNIIITSIKRSIDTVLLVCGIVTIFLLVTAIITNTFNFNEYNSMLIKGIMEVTIGIEAISKIKLGMIYKLVITSMFLAFGGLSIHMQTISQITNTSIKYHYFLVGRLYQMIISGIITYVICIIIKI